MCNEFVDQLGVIRAQVAEGWDNVSLERHTFGAMQWHIWRGLHNLALEVFF